MGSRYLAICAAFMLGISVAGGVAIAAGQPTQVKACTNAKGVLRLLSSSGTCPPTFHKIAISQQGPKGARGARGPKGSPGVPGPRGEAGATGPDSQSSIATSKVPIGAAVSLADTKLVVTAECTSATFSKLIITGSGDYLVHGVSDLSVSDPSVTGKADSHPSTGAETDVIDTGSALIDFETDTTSAKTTSDITVSGTPGGGDLSTDLLVSEGTRTFTVDVFLSLTAKSCQAAAQITPTA
jgi:hypothetical protein